MELNEYQELAKRTMANLLPFELLQEGCMGLNGESGEAIDHLKKNMFQNHPLDREHMKEELGDALWYISEAAYALDTTMEEIATNNIAKLKERYPAGFDSERSIHREDY